MLLTLLKRLHPLQGLGFFLPLFQDTHGKKRWEDQQLLQPLPRYSPNGVGKGKMVSAGDKMVCPTLRKSLSPPRVPVISGEVQRPISLAGTLLEERARLFAHLASPEVFAGRRGGLRWASTGGLSIFYLFSIGADPNSLFSNGGVCSAGHKAVPGTRRGGQGATKLSQGAGG